jgi:hypothetical protein
MHKPLMLELWYRAGHESRNTLLRLIESKRSFKICVPSLILLGELNVPARNWEVDTKF